MTSCFLHIYAQKLKLAKIWKKVISIKNKQTKENKNRKQKQAHTNKQALQLVGVQPRGEQVVFNIQSSKLWEMGFPDFG